jgi:GNAT superfamily N-acetyltransferase
VIAPDIDALRARIPAPLRVGVGDFERDLDRFIAFQDRFARPAEVERPEIIRRFEAKNPQPKRLVLMVESDRDEVVAAGYMSDGGFFRPKDGAFRGEVRVDATWRRRGIGSALLERLEAHARSNGAPRILSNVRGDETDGVRFAERHGYREVNRRFDSYLDVEKFDASRFEAPEEVARRAGVRIATFAEVEAERPGNVDELQREAYELGSALTVDIPRPEPIPLPPYEAIRDVFFGPDTFDRDSSILALRDGKMVAITVTAPRTPEVAYTNFTGTLRAERGKGLALALKLRAIEALQKKKGTRLFGTTNDEANAAMRGINLRLGYVADPPRIELEKKLA